MTGILLQVRLDSSRLPGKALLPLGGKTVIEQVMDSLAAVQTDVHAVVTDEASAGELEPLIRKSTFEMFIGPKEDVLMRYIKAAGHFGLDTIVRATGDNPLVSSRLANLLLTRFAAVSPSPDYIAFTGPPIGTGVEVVKRSALERASTETEEPYYREHVCPYVYEHPGEFHIQRLDAPVEFCSPDKKVTLDTQDDYERLLEIYDDIYTGSPINVSALVRYLEGRTKNAETDGRMKG